MPWRDPSNWADLICKWLALWLLPMLTMGTMWLYRMYDDNGRRCLTFRQVITELPGFVVVVLMCAGLIEYYDLGPQASMAVFATFSWLGPRVILGFFLAALKTLEDKVK